MTPASTSTSLRFALLLTTASGFLDAYTFVGRGGVFANAQTGNVVLLGVDVSQHHWDGAVEHLAPILAFIVGVTFARLLRSRRAEHRLPHPIRAAMIAQIAVLIAVAFVPVGASSVVVTIPVAFVAAVQIGLFRTVRAMNYVAIVTTGNLMRLTEAAYAGFIERDRKARTATRTYAAIVISFAVGAAAGAVCTHAIHARAAVIPAAMLSLALGLFYLDDVTVRRNA